MNPDVIIYEDKNDVLLWVAALELCRRTFHFRNVKHQQKSPVFIKICDFYSPVVSNSVRSHILKDKQAVIVSGALGSNLVLDIMSKANFTLLIGNFSLVDDKGEKLSHHEIKNISKFERFKFKQTLLRTIPREKYYFFRKKRDNNFYMSYWNFLFGDEFAVPLVFQFLDYYRHYSSDPRHSIATKTSHVLSKLNKNVSTLITILNDEVFLKLFDSIDLIDPFLSCFDRYTPYKLKKMEYKYFTRFADDGPIELVSSLNSFSHHKEICEFLYGESIECSIISVWMVDSPFMENVKYTTLVHGTRPYKKQYTKNSVLLGNFICECGDDIIHAIRNYEFDGINITLKVKPLISKENRKILSEIDETSARGMKPPSRRDEIQNINYTLQDRERYLSTICEYLTTLVIYNNFEMRGIVFQSNLDRLFREMEIDFPEYVGLVVEESLFPPAI